MVTVTVRAIVDNERQLHITVPDDMPTGPVEVQITALPIAPPLTPGAELTREQARAILLEAGLLSTVRYAPTDATPLTDEEREELGQLYAGEPSVSEMLIEDRRERWD